MRKFRHIYSLNIWISKIGGKYARKKTYKCKEN